MTHRAHGARALTAAVAGAVVLTVPALAGTASVAPAGGGGSAHALAKPAKAGAVTPKRVVKLEKQLKKLTKQLAMQQKLVKQLQLRVGGVGQTGRDGAGGSSGASGSNGTNGANGTVGPRGPQGERGVEGPVGPAGPMGPTGPTGLTGPQGSTGPQGPAGPQGPVGPPGDGAASVGKVMDSASPFSAANMETQAQVSCPAGQRATGGGGYVTDGAKGFVTGSWPLLDINGNSVGWIIKYRASVSGNIPYEVYALCLS